MSPAGMVAIRMAATLAHVLPTVRLRVRHGDVTLLEVASHPAGGGGNVVASCSFRRAVAGAHEHAKQGRRLGLLGLPDGAEPAIDVGTRPGDAVLPGGVYRVHLGDQTIDGFTTTLPLRHCRSAIEALPDDDHLLRLHHDAATEVTFVHTVTPSSAAPEGAAHLSPVLAALVAEEVVRELAGAR